MGFFKSLKGKIHDDVHATDDTSQNSAQYGTTRQDEHSTEHENRGLFKRSQPSSTASISSLNPTQVSSSLQTGPSSFQKRSEDFLPPSGPPPYASNAFAPPPGTPPTATLQNTNPPPYHDWTVIPDTSLLPPPPDLPQDRSPTNNASYDSAAAARAWCDHNPVYNPNQPSPQIHDAVTSGNIPFDSPPNSKGSVPTATVVSPGKSRIKTKSTKQDSDTIFLSTLPLYFAASDNPLLTEREKLVYYEVQILSIKNNNSSGVAVGFASKPYPPWRLPGWHRASIGVHGDDGRRFVNDSWGGRDFVEPFTCVGDVVGLGMRFLVQPMTVQEGGEEDVRVKTKAFFTRGGRVEGEWEIDEERDAEHDEGVDGLMGERDMYAAVGCFGSVELEVRLRREQWLYMDRC